ncbi:MAG TPA: hypothetical protein DCM62_01840 [Bacteroidales bacterium]|nr:hypothetical protein [Bacteroidales bacterium]
MEYALSFTETKVKVFGWESAIFTKIIDNGLFQTVVGENIYIAAWNRKPCLAELQIPPYQETNPEGFEGL